MVRTEVLRALESSRGGQVSGETLAAQLGVSRAAIWKAVQKLREEGLAIAAVPGGGYVLSREDDCLTAAAIQSGLATKALGRELVIVHETDSTNSLIKRQFSSAPHGLAVLAETQTGGRGRLGRSFFSPPGCGLYLSILLRPALPLSQLQFLTLAAAVSVCRAVEETAGFAPQIKWVNDVLMENKKLCGILTEASIEGETGAIDFAIVGIGVNLRLDHAAQPPEIRAVAGALSEFCAQPPRRAILAAAILNHMETLYMLIETGRTDALLAAYRERLCVIDKTVRVCTPDGGYEAHILDVDENGHLVARTADGSLHTLATGEISIRL